MLNFKAKIFVFVILLFTFNLATASSANSLYYVEIAVADEAGDTRWKAFVDGMNQVFVRISGDSIVMDKLKRPPASRYVKQFSYEPIEVTTPVTSAEGEVLSYRLKIQYNGTAMEKYLLDSGFPVWGQHRPNVVIWLAVRDGSNEYVLKSADQSILKSAVNKAMERRGVPELWPVYDLKDRKILSVAEIRGGFKEPVVEATKRYTRGPALTGSLIWNGKIWQSSWGLNMKNGDRHWSLVDANYNTLIDKAIDQAADALGVAFAVHASAANQKLATIQLDLQSINSIEKYRYAEDYLMGLNGVEIIKPLQVNGQNAVFELMLNNDEKTFVDSLKQDPKLIEVAVEKVPEKNLPNDIQDAKNETGTVTEADKIDASTTDMPTDNIATYYYKLIH